MKICPVGAELFYADGQTDMTKLIVAFRNFAKAPNVFDVVRTCQNISKNTDKLQQFLIRMLLSKT
jgi:hypothetical protein